MPISRSEQARLNGARSRGPKTTEGKAVSSMNALRHGRRANPAPAAPQGPEFELLLSDHIAHLGPRSAAESALVHQVAAASWQIDHWRRIETAVMKRIYNRSCPAGDEPGTYDTFAAALESSFKGPSLLSFILRRQSEYRVARDRALRTLQLGRQSKVLTAPMPETVRQNVAQDDTFESAKTPQLQVQATDGKALPRPVPETSEPKRTCHTQISNDPLGQTSPSTFPANRRTPEPLRTTFLNCQKHSKGHRNELIQNALSIPLHKRTNPIRTVPPLASGETSPASCASVPLRPKGPAWKCSSRNVMFATDSDDRSMMPINEVDLATLSESDVIKLRIENRAWSKAIRLCMAALVNRRMANQISYEEYAASRKAAKDERAECDRTMAMLGG